MNYYFLLTPRNLLYYFDNSSFFMIYICDNIIIFNYLTYVMPAACVSIITS